MAQRIYFLNGKQYYEVSISRRDLNKKSIKKRTRFNKKGQRIATKQSADKIEYQLRKEVEALAVKSKTITWQDWQSECLRRMQKTLLKGTVIAYDGPLKKWLSPRWNQLPIDKITRDDIYDLIFEYIPNRDGFTVNIQKKIVARIRRIFTMAVEDGILPRNPCLGIKIKTPVQKKRVLNSSEASALLKAAKSCNHRFYYHWGMALFTGMRNGELYALRWVDIDMQTGLISVNKQWTSKDGLHPTKNNRERVIPICKELQKLLTELKQKGSFQENLWAGSNKIKKYPKEHPERENTLITDFVLPRLREWRNGEQSHHLKIFCRAMGIEEVKFHDLRATLITNMLSQGVSLVKVMSIVGHSKMSTTDEYLRLAGVEVKHDTTDSLGYRLPEEKSLN